ncbi:abortive infection system antitoxin AbiGi family protein [Candidatus Contubernalis alkaliaceticus]|uniref:abortive infection system antitoxin AbiGi family protein n=1 Tax=Candidatus Contubernalis alkaliaceticus TaxID=338645 RepID=UPI001F4BD37D|nr:abortive infection system antitoxin AbiGi family protein [Candidatus Contubernalis alkalaceticus]UNC91646.1 hypothetical protein HUE98_05800 [Candidatus Contubernalis alkalaceticus]
MQRYYSNIYWHFTGGPEVDDWSKVKAPKEIEGKLKSTEKAVDNLKLILSSKKLKAGSPEKIHGDIITGEFCCVCDIPIKDLTNHAKYYGKVAIGFNANAIHSCFNPVLYIEKNFPIPDDLKFDMNAKIRLDTLVDLDAPFDLIDILLGLNESPEYNQYLKKYFGNMKNLIKITRFSDKDDETFYREREWRSLNGDFNYKIEDVEALIVPEEFIGKIKEHLEKCKIIKYIPIIPFEFLEKA